MQSLAEKRSRVQYRAHPASAPRGMTYAYSSEEANVALWLSSAAYCDMNFFETRVFAGPTHGFVVTARIHDARTDAVGFIGFLNRLRRIYVVFRGTQSLNNIVLDMQVETVPYASYPNCSCRVHRGFYAAEQAVIASVSQAVRRLAVHTGYGVTVTGHSLGGALAHLTALDLLRDGVVPSVYTFGQPRVGDIAFANLLTETPAARAVSEGGGSVLWRVTHDRDMVPHLPLGDRYYHACREVFESANASAGVRLCAAGDCQDPTCSMQYYFPQTIARDHSRYLGRSVTCEAVS